MRRLIGWMVPKTAAHASTPSWWQRIKMLMLACAGLGLVTTAGLAYAERDRVITELHQLGAEAGLKLRHIQVRGRSHISKDSLLAALDLQLDAPIFSINLQDLYDRVSQIGWVKKCHH